MKWIKFLVPLVAVFIGGLWIGYARGFHDRPPLSPKEELLIRIEIDTGNYNLLKDGNVDVVKAILRTYILGEIRAYDLYKKEDPTYNTENESRKSWVEKARIIAQEEQKRIDSASIEAK